MTDDGSQSTSVSPRVDVLDWLPASSFEFQDVRVEAAVTWILRQQLADGGWNCESIRSGSRHGSFHTSISVLEALLAYQLAGGSIPVVAGIRRGHDFFASVEVVAGLSSLSIHWQHRRHTPNRLSVGPNDGCIGWDWSFDAPILDLGLELAERCAGLQRVNVTVERRNMHKRDAVIEAHRGMPEALGARVRQLGEYVSNQAFVLVGAFGLGLIADYFGYAHD